MLFYALLCSFMLYYALLCSIEQISKAEQSRERVRTK
jgi:hypothetical protein